MKKTILIAALTVSSIATSHAVLSVGSIYNIDYGTGNIGPVTGATAAGVIGVANDTWNSNNGGYVDPSTGKLANNATVSIGSFVNSSATGGSTGNWQWGGAGGTGNPLTQDYVYLTDSGGTPAGDVTIPGEAGLTVGAYRRFTVFSPGNVGSSVLLPDQRWNITFIGAGNAVGQGMHVAIKQQLNGVGAISYQTLTNTGAVLGPGLTAGSNYGSLNNLQVTKQAANANYEFEFYLFVPTGQSGQALNSAINGLQMQLVTIPEPSAALLGGLGMLALLRRRR